MPTLIGPKPKNASGNVDQLRLGETCSLTVTSWAAALPSFSEVDGVGKAAGGLDDALGSEARGAEASVGIAGARGLPSVHKEIKLLMSIFVFGLRTTSPI